MCSQASRDRLSSDSQFHDLGILRDFQYKLWYWFFMKEKRRKPTPQELAEIGWMRTGGRRDLGYTGTPQTGLTRRCLTKTQMRSLNEKSRTSMLVYCESDRQVRRNASASRKARKRRIHRVPQRFKALRHRRRNHFCQSGSYTGLVRHQGLRSHRRYSR